MISTPCLATRGFLYAANAPEPACRQAGGRNANGRRGTSSDGPRVTTGKP
jgi:hypothetical protein